MTTAALRELHASLLADAERHDRRAVYLDSQGLTAAADAERVKAAECRDAVTGCAPWDVTANVSAL